MSDKRKRRHPVPGKLSLDKAGSTYPENTSTTPLADPGSYYDETPAIPERVPPRDRSQDRHPMMDPSIHNAHAMHMIAPELMDDSEGVEVWGFRPVIVQLRNEVKRLRQGDTSFIEEALLGQGMTLNVLFSRLLEWAFTASSREKLEARLPLALQVQNNARKTFETLASVRNGGRPIVLNQQNIAGVQQVNNDLASQSPVTQVLANELLEVSKDERLDTRAPRATSATDSNVDTVGKGRSENA